MIQMINKQNLVIKGEENNAEDANIAAKREEKRVIQQYNSKKKKMDHFMNNTKANASKLFKESVKKNNKEITQKKNVLEKQKQLKQKYTLLNKKDEPKNLHVKPVKVEWKQAVEGTNRSVIGHNKLQQRQYQSQDDIRSQIDSQAEIQQIETPQQLIHIRQNIRNVMLKKTK